MKKTPAHSTTKLGPGEYRPDIAFTRLEDLPPPKLIKQSQNYESRPCPHFPFVPLHWLLFQGQEVVPGVMARPVGPCDVE